MGLQSIQRKWPDKSQSGALKDAPEFGCDHVGAICIAEGVRLLGSILDKLSLSLFMQAGIGQSSSHQSLF